MYDSVRWTLLFLIFAGLLGFYAWNWYRNYGKAMISGKIIEPGFKLIHKRSIDYRTGICLVEANGQSYLLAYTAEGGVSWQPLGPKAESAEQLVPDSGITIGLNSISEKVANLRLIP